MYMCLYPVYSVYSVCAGVYADCAQVCAQVYIMYTDLQPRGQLPRALKSVWRLLCEWTRWPQALGSLTCISPGEARLLHEEEISRQQRWRQEGISLFTRGPGGCQTVCPNVPS